MVPIPLDGESLAVAGNNWQAGNLSLRRRHGAQRQSLGSEDFQGHQGAILEPSEWQGSHRGSERDRKQADSLGNCESPGIRHKVKEQAECLEEQSQI